jgi:hypothetical protein
MARPKADLDAKIIPKDGRVNSAESAPTDQLGLKGYAHTLSLRLTAEDYRGLRRYVADQEEKTGKRVTHQSLLEGLLRAFLMEYKRR